MRLPRQSAPAGTPFRRPASALLLGLLHAGLLPLGACDGGDRGGARDRPGVGAPESPPPAVGGADSGAARSDALERWSGVAEEEVGPETGRGILRAVRAARHDGYDRLVLEFSGNLPGYAVRYPSDSLRQCGSGRPIRVDAPHVLQVTLRSAAAHDEDGRATVQDRDREPALPVLRTARLTCDFEGEVEWVLGVERRAPFRALALRDPPRLVIDLRHP